MEPNCRKSRVLVNLWRGTQCKMIWFMRSLARWLLLARLHQQNLMICFLYLVARQHCLYDTRGSSHGIPQAEWHEVTKKVYEHIYVALCVLYFAHDIFNYFYCFFDVFLKRTGFFHGSARGNVSTNCSSFVGPALFLMLSARHDQMRLERLQLCS